ncbi:MAG TPA: hypothetical protein VNW72_11210 [Chthoniobacterales bacterium]|jgi:hypothetical protein|nr:hypothetical protein [Chthoniobacterales bacterium]
MALYLTRVELHGASYGDYETLHDAMEAEGFERTITGNDGKTYQLPTAEYYRQTNLNRAAVRESAERAADKTKKSYGVIVAEAVGMTWTGLAEV